MDRYRKEGKTFCVDVKFHELNQLYDGRDPAPFRERDLDEDLIKYLLMSREELPERAPIKVVLSGPKDMDQKSKDDFVEAFHQYFQHEVRSMENELKKLLRLGRTSLFVGIGFLVICTFFAYNIVGERSIFHRVFQEGLFIMGWVALWRPINIFLYEWWPLLRQRQVFGDLSKINVEFK